MFVGRTLIDEAEARRRGYSVDRLMYPPFAYKGYRFAPTEWIEILTYPEYEMYRMLKTLLSEIDETQNPPNTLYSKVDFDVRALVKACEVGAKPEEII